MKLSIKKIVESVTQILRLNGPGCVNCRRSWEIVKKHVPYSPYGTALPVPMCEECWQKETPKEIIDALERRKAMYADLRRRGWRPR